MKPLKIIESIVDLETAMNRFQACDANVRKYSAKLSEKIATERDAMNEAVGADAEEAKRLQNMIEEFATKNRTNPEIFPAGKKSLDLQAGTISFRTGPLSIALKKGTKSQDVVEAAKRMKLDIIRTPEPELDKAAVKDLIDAGTIDDENLRSLGLIANQSETLNIKLNDQ